jgi:hypothetical protein
MKYVFRYCTQITPKGQEKVNLNEFIYSINNVLELLFKIKLSHSPVGVFTMLGGHYDYELVLETHYNFEEDWGKYEEIK